MDVSYPPFCLLHDLNGDAMGSLAGASVEVVRISIDGIPDGLQPYIATTDTQARDHGFHGRQSNKDRSNETTHLFDVVSLVDVARRQLHEEKATSLISGHTKTPSVIKRQPMSRCHRKYDLGALLYGVSTYGWIRCQNSLVSRSLGPI